MTAISAPLVLDRRPVRLAAFALAVVLLGYAGLVLYATATTTFAGLAGLDLDAYLAATRRWLASGTPYLANEVAGPFAYAPLTFLHPPLALLLFVPFLVLPAVLWWAIPVALTVVAIGSLRPAPWTWPLMAAGLCVPSFSAAFVVGNTDLWVCAFLAAGLRWGWPAVLIVAKPSLIPLAFVGAVDRAWWISAAVLGAVALAFGSLWLDWLHVVLNSPGSILYSLGAVPWLLFPVIARLGARTA